MSFASSKRRCRICVAGAMLEVGMVELRRATPCRATLADWRLGIWMLARNGGMSSSCAASAVSILIFIHAALGATPAVL